MPGVPELSPTEFAARWPNFAGGEEVVLLDVREHDELAIAAVDGALHIPMREVPVGYIYEVITKGYGGMPSYSAQISPADRWRIVAYVRALQYSQHAPAGGKP